MNYAKDSENEVFFAKILKINDPRQNEVRTSKFTQLLKIAAQRWGCISLLP